jgi:endonuclease YncB( thermonuclease family)
MWRILAVLSSLAMLSLAPAASAADLIGQASIIDGDTIEIHGQRIRLTEIEKTS